MLAIKCIYRCLVSLYIFCAAVKGHHTHRHKTHIQHDKLQQISLISTKELRKISEEIFDKLPDDIFDFININYQGQRDSKDVKDEAPEPLLSVSSDLFETTPTIHEMRKLYDNYDMNTQHAEIITPKEDMEENSFIDELLNTSIMIHTMDFLASKGYFRKNLNEYRQILKKIWFQPYSRNNRTELGSSGFEHVFLVEKKRSYITGLHNWIFFATAEYDDKANYLGYIAMEKLANKAVILKMYLSYMEKVKLSSMFIGTPPEFEIALYTLCFYARPNKSCKVLLGNVKVTIQTWVQYSNNEQMVASSFPKIYSQTHKYL